MKPRLERYLAVLVFALLVCASVLPASAAPRPQDAQQNELALEPAAARAGETFTGMPGITETVDEIMAREPSIPELLARPDGRAARRRLARQENPLAPAVSSWPPAASASGADAPPLLLAGGPNQPVILGTHFLAVTQPESGWVPPDASGAVGPTQVMVVANGRIKVFDKAGNLGPLDVSSDTFFASVRTTTTTDARVRYDRLSGRWFVTIQTRECPDDFILIAVSSGSTITGQASFTFYRFMAETGRQVDDSSLGVDRNALYIGGQMLNCGGNVVASSVFVVRKSDLLAGTLTVTAFRNLSDLWGPQGVQNDDPAATEGYVIGADTNVQSRLQILRVNTPG